jgi:hypothetical protein
VVEAVLNIMKKLSSLMSAQKFELFSSYVVEAVLNIVKKILSLMSTQKFDLFQFLRGGGGA